MKLSKINKAISNPRLALIVMLNKVACLLPDTTFLKLKYRLTMKKRLDLIHPQTYNEKIQWLKLFDIKPEYTQMVDKIGAKKYVSNIIGEEYIIPTLGTWENANDIDFDILPDQFVLKCTHDSGGVVICKDKSNLDISSTRKFLKKSLKRGFYSTSREWPYKNVKRCILAEQFMVDESGTELKDYKFFCFDGEPKAMFIASDRGTDTRFDFYDMDFKHLPFTNGHENANKTIPKPDNFDKMVEISRKLSQGLTHVRVDLYNINGKIYFGELTFYHWSGMVPFIPEEWDYIFGTWINLKVK